MNSIFNKIWESRLEFLGTFFLVFTLSYIVLMALDFLPEPKTEDVMETTDAVVQSTSSDTGAYIEVPASLEDLEVAPIEVEETQIQTDVLVNHAVTLPTAAELPKSIYIEKLDKEVLVNNPTSRTIADLDNALLSGVVRHPDSATLNQDGNVFILGHSSYLPKVLNKNFQAFNGIQNLEWGDKIRVYSEENVYEYRVDKVYRAKAQDVTVPIAGTGNMLTLATCNSFGSTDDRYIVEAKLIAASSL